MNALKTAYEQNENHAILELLLTHAVQTSISVRDLDIEDSNRDRCLHSAARLGNAELAKTLLKYDFDIDVKNFYGETALHLASDIGHPAVVKVLLDHGANVEDHNENGHTPLMEAASAGHVKVAKVGLFT